MNNLEPIKLKSETFEAVENSKKSWVGLGVKFWNIIQKKLYRVWGFDSMNFYVVEDLKIRKSEFTKIMKAFHFVALEKPDIVTEEDVFIPDLQTIIKTLSAIKKLPKENADFLKEKVLNGYVEDDFIKNYLEDFGIKEIDNSKSKIVSDFAKEIAKDIKKLKGDLILENISEKLGEAKQLILEGFEEEVEVK